VANIWKIRKVSKFKIFILRLPEINPEVFHGYPLSEYRAKIKSYTDTIKKCFDYEKGFLKMVAHVRQPKDQDMA